MFLPIQFTQQLKTRIDDYNYHKIGIIRNKSPLRTETRDKYYVMNQVSRQNTQTKQSTRQGISCEISTQTRVEYPIVQPIRFGTQSKVLRRKKNGLAVFSAVKKIENADNSRWKSSSVQPQRKVLNLEQITTKTKTNVKIQLNHLWCNEYSQ